VYCIVSEKRNANADAETSAVRVLLSGRSYIFGRASGFDEPTAVVIDGADGIEKRVELAVGERSSADESEDAERTEKRLEAILT
jgi:hypothetical protein